MAAQPLLNSGTVVAVLKLLPEPSQGLPRVEANEEEDAGVGKHEKFELKRREINGVLLEFPSRFLKKFKVEMVDTGSYNGWKGDLILIVKVYHRA